MKNRAFQPERSEKHQHKQAKKEQLRKKSIVAANAKCGEKWKWGQDTQNEKQNEINPLVKKRNIYKFTVSTQVGQL